MDKKTENLNKLHVDKLLWYNLIKRINKEFLIHHRFIDGSRKRFHYLNIFYLHNLDSICTKRNVHWRYHQAISIKVTVMKTCNYSRCRKSRLFNTVAMFWQRIWILKHVLSSIDICLCYFPKFCANKTVLNAGEQFRMVQ